jgi:hypothetical protein
VFLCYFIVALENNHAVIKSYFLLLSISLLIACNEEVKIVSDSSGVGSELEEEVTYSKKQLSELKTASRVVYNLPSPSEMAEILHETIAIYDVEILSNPKAEGKYNTDITRALNLGVYFADLSFTSMFNYPQQAMLFMSAAQGLSQELDIVGIFNQDLMTRLEENLSDKDSIMDIVSFTYMETDFHLQQNERQMVAKVILAGGWVEGLYIATHLKTEDDNPSLIWKKIGEQKRALSNLIKMLEDCNEPQLGAFIAKLNKLEVAYKGVKIIQNVSSLDSIRTGVIKNNIIVSDMTAANIDLEVSSCRDYMVFGK